MKITLLLYMLISGIFFFSCQSSSQEKNIQEEMHFLFEKGDSCREHGDEESAVNFYNQSLNLVKCENDSWLEATLYSRLGTIYMYREIYSAALEMFKLGASIYATIPPCVERAITLRNIGRVNLLQHQSDSIFCYYDQALEVAMQLSDEELQHKISSELEAIYSKIGLFHFSTRILLRFLDSLEDKASTYLLLGEYESFQNRKDDARKWLLKATQTNDMYICSNAYLQLYNLEKEEQCWEAAVHYADSYNQCRDSLEQQLSYSSDIRALGQKYEKERLQSENRELQNEQLRRRMHYLIGILVVCFLFIIVLFFYYREKRKKEEELSRIMQRLRENEQQIGDYTSLLQENKRMVANLLSDQKKNSVLLEEKGMEYENLKERNNRLSTELRTLLSDREGILRRLNVGTFEMNFSEQYMAYTHLCQLRSEPYYGLLETQKEWDQLYVIIDLLYGDISEKISKYGLLTEQDKRVCYLLHMGINNTDLGRLFNIDSRSVTKSKQRIKKKMNLAPDDLLEEFLLK